MLDHTLRSPHGTDAALGTLVRRFRRAAGLSQEELAAQASLSARTLSNIERGTIRKPQAETLRLIAEALQLSPADTGLLVGAAHAPKATSPPAFAAPLIASAQRSELPVPLTPLIGRSRELAAVATTLRRDDVRLVTLTGPGGVGKTRLALSVAAESRGEFADGVFFVSLAPIREPEVLFLAVAQVLGVKTVVQTPYDAVRDWLRARQVLMVLDNFEHLQSEAVMVANLLIACPRLVVLATSRVPLHLRGEHEHPLHPLAVPVPAQRANVSTVAQTPAVRVFGYYARAVQPGFRVSAENAAAVAALCAHLDGLPLALELAAARVKWFTPSALLARLTPRLPTLTDGASDAPLRQQTLRDTIRWSYDLLGTEERRLFARFAVFAGGATAEALVAVNGADAARHALALADQSLLTVTPDGAGEPRFGMLETIREFAWERLADRGEIAETRRRHAEYVLAFAEEAPPHLGGRAGAQWMARVRPEHDNARVALHWARDTEAAEMGLRTAVALTPYWKDQGHLREGGEWLQSLLQLDGGTGPQYETAHAQGLVSAGDLAHRKADYDIAVSLCTEGLALARQRGDVRTVARACHTLGIIALDRGDPAQFRACLDESLALYQRLNETSAVGNALHCLAEGARSAGDYPRAIRLLEESLTLFRSLDEESNIARVLGTLARTWNTSGSAEKAIPSARESLAIYRRQGNTLWLMPGLFILGDVLRGANRNAEAIPLYEEGIALSREIGAVREEFWGVMARAEALFACSDHVAAAAAFAQGITLAGQLRAKQPFAPGLEGVAILAHALGQYADATTLLGAATILQETMSIPPRPESARIADIARSALGDEEFSDAWERGCTMPLEDAVTQAMTFLQWVSARGGDATGRMP